jgi:hypothetical protein
MLPDLRPVLWVVGSRNIPVPSPQRGRGSRCVLKQIRKKDQQGGDDDGVEKGRIEESADCVHPCVSVLSVSH